MVKPNIKSVGSDTNWKHT